MKKKKKSNHNVVTCSKKPVPYNLKFGKGLNIGSMTLPSVPKSLGKGGGGLFRSGTEGHDGFGGTCN